MEYKIKVHGEYPTTMGYNLVMFVSTKTAYELFCDCLKQAEGVEENDIPSIGEFEQKFINKGFKILNEVQNTYTALYRHDERWSLIRIDKALYFDYYERKPEEVVKFVRY